MQVKLLNNDTNCKKVDTFFGLDGHLLISFNKMLLIVLKSASFCVPLQKSDFL